MTKTRIIFLAVMLILCIGLAHSLDKYTSQKFNDKYQNLDNSSALLDIIGELRYTAAALLWMKTDYYQHEAEYSHKDFKKLESIMPLIRLVTLLDPHFIQAYDFGAYHLIVNLKKPEEGMKFLAEGLRNNPETYDLNWEYGFLLYFQKKYKEALPYLLKARELKDQKTPVYEDYMKISWVNSRIVSCYKEIGEPEKAEPYQKELDDWAAANKKAEEAVKAKEANSDKEHDHKGHNHEGHNHEGHDHEGHDHEGHDHEGHDHEGHDHEGHDHEGHDHEGHDHEGHDHEGHDHEGHDHEGH